MSQKRAVKWTFILVGVPIVLLGLVWGGLEYASYRNEQQLEATMSTVDVPDNWVLQEELHAGDISCLDICQYYKKTYTVSYNIEELDNIENTILTNIVKSTNFNTKNIETGCLEKDNFNDLYCFARAETLNGEYRISSSITEESSKDELFIAGVGVYKK